MNSAELTALHTETMEEIRLQRTLANITRRAETLFDDGYTVKQEKGFYIVYGSQGQTYIVFTGNPDTGEDCSCPAFDKYGTCKHHLAVREMLREDAMCADHDAMDAHNNEYALRSDCNSYGY